MSSEPEVEIIKDTICDNNRITTFKVKYWRPLLAEMNTHRMFSRNAQSSRATKFMDTCDRVRYDPWLPSHWNSEQRGMVGKEEFDSKAKEFIESEIKSLAEYTVGFLESLNKEMVYRYGAEIHKQYLNRYLEPFLPTTQLITATDWDNFFKLRCAPDAQPEIRDVAILMKDLYEHSEPEKNTWHMPFIREEEQSLSLKDRLTVSVARCARVSYPKRDYSIEQDMKLAKRLYKDGHMSPFEHVAIIGAPRYYYNLNGWESLRWLLDHQNYTYYFE